MALNRTFGLILNPINERNGPMFRDLQNIQTNIHRICQMFNNH
jgi:hypothetical protein